MLELAEAIKILLQVGCRAHVGHMFIPARGVGELQFSRGFEIGIIENSLHLVHNHNPIFKWLFHLEQRMGHFR